jgi:hypothetical protein
MLRRAVLGLIGVAFLLTSIAPTVGVLPAEAAEACPNEQLRAENGSLQLPDCRAYELVSPAEKTDGGGDVLAFEYNDGQLPNPMQATASGTEVTYTGEDFFGTQAGGLNQYISTRGPARWTTINITPRTQELSITGRIIGMSSSLTDFVFASEIGPQLTSEAPGEYRDLYLFNREGGAVALLTRKPPDRERERFGEAQPHSGVGRFAVAPASEDLSRILFSANDALVEGAVDGGQDANNLYQWAGGRVRLVNVLSDGAAEPNASFGLDYAAENPEERVETKEVPNLDHAVSTNGMRAFWTADNTGNLYLRESYVESGEEKERTVEVDAAVGGGGRFLTASADGERVFFAKNEQLYEYDVQNSATIDLTPSPSTGLQGIVGTSENGEYVYFVARGALASGASPQTCTITGEDAIERAEEAEGRLPSGRGCNMYVDHDGALAFVAALSVKDDEPAPFVPEGQLGGGVGNVADWAHTVGVRTAEVSPDGEFVALASHLALTGRLDNGPEIFVYDAASGTLLCASCSPEGVTNEGAVPAPFADTYGTHRQRYILNDGRVFFTTTAALVPQDTNGEKDVYEWENGQVHLISGGASASPSVFADASEDGSDVFFTTSTALVPFDHDEIVDLYDAREDGGFPGSTPSEPCDTTDACQGEQTATPEFGAPASVTVSGTGNVAFTLSPSVTAGTRRMTRTEKLTHALRVCRKEQKGKRERASCERRARSEYGSAKQKGKRRKTK